MSGRRSDDGDRGSDGEGIEARVRMRPLDVHRTIRSVFNVSAMIFWGASAFGAWKLAPSAVRATLSLTEAVTRASVAMERSNEGMVRIETTTTRARDEVGEMRREMAERLDRLSVTCARCETGRR